MGELPHTKNQFWLPLKMPFIKSFFLSWEEYDGILTSVLCCKTQWLAWQQGRCQGKDVRQHQRVCFYLTHASLYLASPLLSSNHPHTLFWACSLSFPSFLVAVRWCHLDVKIKTPCDAPAVPSAGRPEGCVCKSQRGWTRSGVSTFI